MEDGVLSDNSLVWTSDKDGQIGTGESSSITTLSVNTHIITLTATDSKGGVNTAEISIIVNEKICYGWSMWQFDARHSGRSPHRGPQTPTLKRIIDSGTICQQPMTDPNGIIYAVVGGWGERSFIRAFNSVGGSKKWERDISAMWDGGGELNGIAINNGILYASLSRSIYALNATDGTTKWRKEVGILFPGADVTLYHNLLYFYSSEGLQVLDTDGNTKWLYQIDPYEGCLAPAISSDGVAYICGDTNLRAIDANGNLLWKCEIGVNNAEEMSSLPFPVVIAPNGTIYIMTYRSISLGTPHSYHMKESRLSVINPDGTLKWKYQVDITYGNCHSPIIGSDGTVYVNFNDKLMVFNAEGVQKWVSDLSSTYIKVLCIDRNNVIYAISQNALLAVKSDGTLKWRYEKSDSDSFNYSIIMAEGILCVGFNAYRDSGSLYVFED